MRRHNRNPARRRDPYPPRRVSTEEAFFDFVAQRPLPPKLAQRRLQRQQEEEEIYEQNQHGEGHTTQQQEQQQEQQQQQQQQGREVGRVLLGSLPLSHPTPPTSTSHQSRSLLAPTPAFLTPSDQGSSRALDAPTRDSGQSLLGFNPFSPTNNASLPSPASPSEAPATLSPDTHPAPLNLGSLAVGQTESAHAGPSSAAPSPYLSSGIGSQAATSQVPAPAPAPASWQAGFFIIGQDLMAQRWDVTVHFQLETSAISRRVVQHHGFRLETGPPGWNNWTIQTPGGLVQPEYFVRGVTLMSTSTWLPIEPMSADFIVLDLEWTGGDVVLARPILSRILNRT